jgi:hypothetical protein
VKASIRLWSRLAFVASVGLTALSACSSDKPDGHADEKRSGKLSLALQATAPSGSVYMLRNAFFEITDIRTGQFIQNLSSDEGLPEARELTTILETGNYTIRLFPGWFLERVSGPNPGTGGMGGIGGMTGTGGAAGAGTAGFPGKAGSGPLPPKPIKAPPEFFAGAPGFAGAPPDDPAAGGSFGVGGSGPIGGDSSSGGSFSTGGSSSTGGSPGTGGSSGGIVEAHLLSDAVQFFNIFGAGDTFVSYQFQVGGEIVDFDHGRLHVGIDVIEAEVPCEGVTMPERMLMETNTQAVSNVGLAQVFKALANNGGHVGDGDALYRQIFDSYASADLGEVPEAVHCGDEQTDGVPTLNGFPIDCNRREALHVNDMNNFFATAFVNRMDLAPASGAHCGQQRMIFANPSNGRTFMIIEAQVPNPAPELGIDGCKPLAQFWLNQNSIADASTRGQRLTQAFLTGGVPELDEAGFGPFYTAENLTIGSGQIRTNQFDSFPWTLREFKLAVDGEQLRAVPFPVAESPHGALWNENSGFAQGPACRENFLTALDGVLTDDMSLMSFVVDQACKNSESRNDFSEDYAGQMTQGLREQIQEKLDSIGAPLTADDVANRARFSGSCIGCHSEASGLDLGNGVRAPFADDFPQVLEVPVPCSGGEQGTCFRTSSGLRQVFLPGRLAVMSSLLGFPIVPNTCNGNGGGTGGSGNMGFGGTSIGGGGPIPSAGSSSSAGKGGAEPFPIPTEPAPAPVIVIELPSTDVPVEQLQEEDQEIREAYGDVTISGRSAKATH